MTCDCRAFFVFQNQLEHFTLSSPSNNLASTTPITNLLRHERSEITRFLNTTPSGTFTSIIEGVSQKGDIADTFALNNFDLTGADTYKLELFDPDNNLVYSSQASQLTSLIPLGIWTVGVHPYGAATDEEVNLTTILRFPLTLYTKFRLTLTSYNNPKGYLDLGMIFAGASFSPERNFAFGYSLTYQNNQSLSRSLGGSLLTDNTPHQYRKLTLPFPSVTKSDRDTFGKLLRKSLGKPILVCATPAAETEARFQEHAFIGFVDTAAPWTTRHSNGHDISLTIQEI